jgi:hypothetical protein
MAILADGEDRYGVRIKRDPNKTYFDEYVKLAIGRTSMQIASIDTLLANLA